MRKDSSTAVGAFDDRAQMEEAVQRLRSAGFDDDQIDIAVHLEEDSAGGTSIAETRSNMEEGIIGGGVIGAILGGLAGAAALGLIPGLSPFLPGGLLEAVAGGALAGILVGAIIGGLLGLSMPEEEERLYQEEFRVGHSIVTVTAPGRVQEATDILREYGAHDLQYHRD
ncbi:MAG TPA: hypothetical protein VHS28_05420 [Chloroflexota bacterium]|nr:hypothetical protein [Chloroflexota bacterium]